MPDGNAEVIHRGGVGQTAGRGRSGGLHHLEQSVELGIGDPRLGAKGLQKGVGIDQGRRGDQEKLAQAAIQAARHVAAEGQTDLLKSREARGITDDESGVGCGGDRPGSEEQQEDA